MIMLQTRPFTRAQGNLLKPDKEDKTIRPATGIVTDEDVIVYKGKCNCQKYSLLISLFYHNLTTK